MGTATAIVIVLLWNGNCYYDVEMMLLCCWNDDSAGGIVIVYRDGYLD